MPVAQPIVTLVGGALFGLALAAPPGPMNAVIAQESVLRGWSAGFRAGLGAMVADACFFVLSLVGAVAVVRRSSTVRAVLFAAGGCLMLYFAYGAVTDARSFVPDETDAGKGFRKAFVLALTNPYQIAFWLTVGVGLLAPGRLDVLGAVPFVGARAAGLLVVRTGSPLLIGGLFGGIVVWIVGFPAALIAARNRIDALAPLIAWLSAAVLAGFGSLFVRNAVGAI